MAVDLSFYKSPLSEEIRDEGRVEGRAEGRVEGRAEGRAEALLLLLEVRRIAISAAAREKITGCGDADLLHRWLKRAVAVTSAEEIFAEAQTGGGEDPL